SAGKKPAAVTAETLPLLVPTTQTCWFQRLKAALMKPCNSPACVALRRNPTVTPLGCAGATSAIITLTPCRRKRSADRIRKLPVESMMVPVASSDKRPLPPVIRTTLARALCAGLSRRTGGVFTMNVVSTVTASASAARAAGEALQKPNAAHAARINADRSKSLACRADISLSFKLRSAQGGAPVETRIIGKHRQARVKTIPSDYQRFGWLRANVRKWRNTSTRHLPEPAPRLSLSGHVVAR